MTSFTSDKIQSWERFYRANFIASLSGLKPVSLIGTINENGDANLGLFSNIVHIGSDPALIGFINRPRKAAPHTLANIEATGVYTINQVTLSLRQQAHQCSAKYPEEVSEFAAVGLTPEYTPYSQAPFVKECRIKTALQLQQILPITINETFLVIGKIVYVSVEEELMANDGFIDLAKANSICSNGIDAYFSAQLLDRFDYAKPEKPFSRLSN